MDRIILTASIDDSLQYSSDNGSEPAASRQAAFVINKLAGDPVHALVSSDDPAAFSTAVAIGDTLDLEPNPMPAFREVDFGSWSFEEYTSWLADSGQGDLPGAETPALASSRSCFALRRVAKLARGRTALVVSHILLVRLTICALIGMPLSNYQSVDQTPGALNILLHDRGKWMVECINDELDMDSFVYPAARTGSAFGGSTASRT